MIERVRVEWRFTSTTTWSPSVHKNRKVLHFLHVRRSLSQLRVQHVRVFGYELYSAI